MRVAERAASASSVAPSTQSPACTTTSAVSTAAHSGAGRSRARFGRWVSLVSTRRTPPWYGKRSLARMTRNVRDGAFANGWRNRFRGLRYRGGALSSPGTKGQPTALSQQESCPIGQSAMTKHCDIRKYVVVIDRFRNLRETWTPHRAVPSFESGGALSPYMWRD